MRPADKITIARTLLLPFMWVFALLNYRLALALLLLLNLIGDILDGYIARKTKKPTKFGARLDAYSDYAVSFSIIIWLYLLIPEIYLDNKILVLVLIAFLSIPFILSSVIFKRAPEYHLISNKINSTIVYIFFFHALLFGYSRVLLYILGVSITINVIEKVILLVKGEMDENIKSVLLR